MKKYLIIACASLIALVSCVKEKGTEELLKPTDGAVLTFTSAKPQLTPDTKTAWDADSRSIVWTSNDKISVGYTLNGNWMAKSGQADVQGDPKVSPQFYASEVVTIDSENASIGTFTVPNSFDFSRAGTAVFYGVFPNSALGSNLDYAPSLTITIPTSQTPGDNTFDPAADLMVGKSGGITLTDALPTDPIDLDWTRLVAHGDLTFSNIADVESETVSKITLTFDDNAKVAGSYYVNVTNGAVTTNSGSKNEIILSGSNLYLSNHSIKAWVSLMPVTFTSLDVEIETNKAYYNRAISGISKTFKQNARNTLSINMATASRTPKTGQLVADGYYVISYDDKMMTVGAENESYRGYATKNITSPADEAIWRINYVSENDAYTIFSLGAKEYLYGAVQSTTSNVLKLGSGDTNLFTIEKTSTEATTYKIAPSGNTVRAIGYNTSNPRFALYTGSTQQPITLDLTSITVDETPVITIDSEEATKTVAASATSVTFAYEANFFATTAPTVNVASDEDGIVNGNPTVADGTITVNLNANQDAIAKSATLTVSGTGIASDITLTINQEAKLGNEYVYLFTSKDWAATRGGETENWTNGKSGSQLESTGSARGVQVQTKDSGANAESPYSFNNISIVTITLAKSSNGVGSVSVKVGDTTIGTLTSFSTSATEYSFNVNNLSGKVSFEVTCSTNSLYVKGLSITAASINLPTAYNITFATGLSHGTITASKTTAYEGDAISLTATPETGYRLDSWNVTGANSGSVINVTNGVFTMPAENVNVTASFVEDLGGPTTVSMSSFSSVQGYVNADSNISYEALKGTAGTAPAINDGQIRIYQNGGLLTITANNSKTITNITIGSAMATYVQVSIDNGSYSSNHAITANGTYSTGTISASTVTFKCTGTDKSSRLYLNSLSVTYE